MSAQLQPTTSQSTTNACGINSGLVHPFSVHSDRRSQ